MPPSLAPETGNENSMETESMRPSGLTERLMTICAGGSAGFGSSVARSSEAIAARSAAS